MSVYGTSVVKRLWKAQAHELDTALLNIAAAERPTSVRGMYYMAMGAGLIDKDAQAKRNNYMRIQRHLLQMRRGGRMPYSWITDGSRTIYGYDRFADEDHFSAYAANIYRKDYWLDSPVRVEVWVEKDAMAGKLKPVVRDEYGLDLYVSRGFASETYLQEAGAHIRSDGRPRRTAAGIVHTLTGNYSAKVRSGRSAALLAEINVREFDHSRGEAKQLTEEERDHLSDRLTQLLSIESFDAAAKASDVAYDHERIIQSARVLTDIRPAYVAEPPEPPVAAVIIHMLKIGYLEDGEEKEFFISLDDSDVEDLIKTLERAKAKTKSLESVLAKAGLRYIDVK